MNRKRKMNDILNKKIKKMNAKKHHSNKPKYVSKADRAKAELVEQELADQASTTSESTNVD